MTALSADYRRILQSGRDAAPISPQVLVNTTIFDGSAVMCLATSHYARPLANVAGGQFLGFSFAHVVAGAVQAAAPTCKIVQQGKLQVANTTANFAAGALVTGDSGKPVWMLDDGTGFVMAVGTNNIPIGKIDNIDLINGVVTIAFESFAMRSI